MLKYQDAKQPIESRINDLISRMTLDEKLAQLCGNLPYNIVENGEVNEKKLDEIGRNGLGRITQYSLVGLSNRNKIAHISNEIQKYFVEKTRLGIPVALQTESLVGYPGEGGTLFPSMTNLAATWDEKLAYQVSSIIGQESHSVGINSSMSPVIDVSRDPRWGRAYETFGEDQYLISKMGVNYIKGLQDKGVSAIAKHFLGYSETQGGLNLATERINSRELYEVFGTPFEAAIKEADVNGIMSSYSEINGLPVGANPEIARKLLRDTMGFKGMLISDGAAIWKMYDYYKIAKSYAEAGLIAKKAGLDTEIPVGNSFKGLNKYVESNQLDVKLIDESVRRILHIKFEQGLFEHPYVDEDKLSVSMTNKDKQNVSYTVAKESIVMLKNKDNVLPLKKGTKVSVIGPHADNIRYPVSGYSYPAYLEMIDASENKSNENVSFNGIADEKKKNKDKKKDGSGFGTMSGMFENLDEINVSKSKEFIKKNGGTSLKESLDKDFDVKYSKGCNINDDDISGIEDAVNTAKDSDVIIVALGGNSGWVNVTGGEGKDRSNLDLPGVQAELLEKLTKLGKPVILTLFGPGIFSLPKLSDQVSAILQCWLPGPFNGKVLSDIIAGNSNVEGKLPVTIPRGVGQVPCFYNHKDGSGYADADNADEGVANVVFTGGYVNESSRPLYEFGFGMSYSKFEISNFELKDDKVPTDGTIECECTVKNLSEISGSEVVQVYYRFHDAHVVRPNKQLIAYKKVQLAAHEQKVVSFSINVNQLGYYDEFMKFVVEPGKATLLLGNSSSNIIDKKTILLTGDKVDILGKRSYLNTPTEKTVDFVE